MPERSTTGEGHLNARGIWAHGGDLGDLLYGLPTIALAASGGRLILHRAPERVREPWTPAKVEAARSLLEAQEYIDWVEFSAEEVPGSYLDGFRDWLAETGNLCSAQLRTNGIRDDGILRFAWIKAPQPSTDAGVILHRSSRYHGERFPWGKIIAHLDRNDLAMVGSAQEHREWCGRFGEVRHLPTPDLISLANVIAGCRLFIGNQSAPFALAMALGKPAILETHASCDNCRLGRDNVIAYGRRGSLPLESIDRISAIGDLPYFAS